MEHLKNFKIALHTSLHDRGAVFIELILNSWYLPYLVYSVMVQYNLWPPSCPYQLCPARHLMVTLQSIHRRLAKTDGNVSDLASNEPPYILTRPPDDDPNPVFSKSLAVQSRPKHRLSFLTQGHRRQQQRDEQRYRTPFARTSAFQSGT